jgi:hypothetical protein
VVSISACHSQERFAGDRGSIPRQRVPIFHFALFVGMRRCVLVLCLAMSTLLQRQRLFFLVYIEALSVLKALFSWT